MNKDYSFYHSETGLFSGVRYSGPEQFLAQNTPAGHRPKEGVHDHLCQKVHLKSGMVIDHIPDPPIGDWIWDRDLKRWMKGPKELQRELAKNQMLALEARALRSQREWQLNPNDAAARQRVIEYDTKINELRVMLGQKDTR